MEILKTIRLNDLVFGPGDEAAFLDCLSANDGDDLVRLRKMAGRGLVAIGPAEGPETADDVTVSVTPENEGSDGTDETTGESDDDSTQPEYDATEAAMILAYKHGIDLSTVTGTGKDGRITKSDVEGLL